VKDISHFYMGAVKLLVALDFSYSIHTFPILYHSFTLKRLKFSLLVL